MNQLFMFGFCLSAEQKEPQRTATRPREFIGQEISNQSMQQEELISKSHM
jgi:hypothetical protein